MNESSINNKDVFLDVMNVFQKISVFVTGSKARTYQALAPDEEIEIAGRTTIIKDGAREFQPLLFVEPLLGPMRPLRIYYDAFQAGARLFINYYVFWQDEIHPNAPWNSAYRVFRKFYYGSARDIEYIQVGVSIETGEPVHLAFERDPSGRHDHPTPRHDVVIASALPGGEFEITVNGGDSDTRPLEIDGRRFCVFVATWNHIYDFYRGQGDPVCDPPLEPMTSSLYEKYFMLRRSRPPYC